MHERAAVKVWELSPINNKLVQEALGPVRILHNKSIYNAKNVAAKRNYN